MNRFAEEVETVFILRHNESGRQISLMKISGALGNGEPHNRAFFKSEIEEFRMIGLALDKATGCQGFYVSLQIGMVSQATLRMTRFRPGITEIQINPGKLAFLKKSSTRRM